jgi:hypothetical protein
MPGLSVLAVADGDPVKLASTATGVGVAPAPPEQRGTRFCKSRRPVRPHSDLRVIRKADADGIEFGTYPPSVSVALVVVADPHRRVQAGQ